MDKIEQYIKPNLEMTVYGVLFFSQLQARLKKENWTRDWEDRDSCQIS